MRYLSKSFTLPAGGGKITQEQWDQAFMSREEFVQKYMVPAVDAAIADCTFLYHPDETATIRATEGC